MAGSFCQTVLEVAGIVKWTDPARSANAAKDGIFSLLRQGLSDIFQVKVQHAAAPRRCSSSIKLVKLGFKISYRAERLALTFSNNSITLSIEQANESQLKKLVDALNDIYQGNIPKVLKPSKGNSPQLPNRRNYPCAIEDIENQPLNSNTRLAPTPNFYGSNQHITSSSPRQAQRLSATLRKKYDSPRSSSLGWIHPQGHNTPQVKKNPLTEKKTSPDIKSPSVSSFYGSRDNNSPTYSSTITIKRNPSISTGKRYGLSKDFSFRKRIQPLYERDVQLTGFSNLGNTCYMNAILQSLLGIGPFAQDLANKELNAKIKSQSCLYKAAYGLLCCKKNISESDVQRMHLRKFKRTISQAATRFSGNSQHDAHEFLCQVLDQLKEDVLNVSPSKPISDGAPNKLMVRERLCPVTRTFECAVVHTISCKGCGASVTSEEIYHDFSLDLPTLLDGSYEVSPDMSGLSIDRLIETYFQTEELEYTCEECGHKHATISHMFSRLPRVLILHLKRYDFNKLTDRHAKKQNNINLKKFIDIGKLCSSKTVSPLKYTMETVKLSPMKRETRLYKRPLDDDDSADEFSHSPSLPSARRKLQEDFPVYTSKSTRTSSALLSSDSDDEVSGTPKTHKPVRHTPKKPCRRPELDFKKPERSELEIESTEGKNPLNLSENEQMEWAIKESMKTATQGSASSDGMESGLEEPPATKEAEERTDHATCDDDDNIMGLTDEELLSALDESGYEDNKKDDSKTTKETTDESNAGGNAMELDEQGEEEGGLLGGAPTGGTDVININDSSDESGLDLSKSTYQMTTNNLSKGKRTDNACRMDTGDECSEQRNGDLSSVMRDRAPTLGRFNGELLITDDGCDGSGRPTPTKGGSGSKAPPPSHTALTTSSPYNTSFRPKYFTTKDPINTKYAVDPASAHIYSNSSDSSMDERPRPPPVSAESKKKFQFKRIHRPVDKHSDDQSFYEDDDFAKAVANSLEDQKSASSDDEQLRKALELSLQEAPSEQRPDQDRVVTPPCDERDLHETLHNSADSGFQDDKDVPVHSYRLVSVVSHLGDRSSSGHYISDVFDCKTGDWTSYDDSTATKVEEHKVRYGRSKVGYILFYLYKQCVDEIRQAS